MFRQRGTQWPILVLALAGLMKVTRTCIHAQLPPELYSKFNQRYQFLSLFQVDKPSILDLNVVRNVVREFIYVNFQKKFGNI